MLVVVPGKEFLKTAESTREYWEYLRVIEYSPCIQKLCTRKQT